jgi:hypothetical protein
MDDADRRIEEQPHLGLMQAATKIYVLAKGRGSQSPKALVKASYAAHNFGRYAQQCTFDIPNLNQIGGWAQNLPPIVMSVVFKRGFGMFFRDSESRYGARSLGLEM